ncbi:FAD-dependent monooxygenase [Conexibacter woesei]|uniref:Monooxygenase FAD-binding protein n=1 Tax=Conexibacter woesei (strain DSM 14684 / CCUG 47730 / CIP 108061 / JCM 11494 / NBRC 100937 / ID131577) TaxID=469383 RepID=D3F3E8_CONWI|nr:FAD-dependent monooxygenase [Conexibacter woesei]ADB52313.1 monooxygenase FAD-binding protein [Conexibacter woesei DSM 14684]
MSEQLPVAVIGAGPVGLVTALGLARYGVETIVLEEDDRLSLDTKAGTVLTRTLEVLHRYGALDDVLRASLRIDEIGDLDRATNTARASVLTGALTEDTRFPFVVNIPQHELEPVLKDALERLAPGALQMSHRLTRFAERDDHVELIAQTPGGERTLKARYVLACDGGRSQVREQLGIAVQGTTLAERYCLVDLKVDLDVDNPRDYPYLAYFGDPQEWMILVRQPHCWRFLYPLAPGRPEPGREELADKARRFIGEVGELEVIGSNVYTVHHRVADRWRDGRVFLMGDAAHLITPMWALGLNTGVLDASNLPWRLAWVLRGWAQPSLLDAYEQEQGPVAIQGSGEMAEAARAYMDGRAGDVEAMGDGNWGNAFTRALLGVSLDVDGSGDWSMVKRGSAPTAVRAGDRAPDLPLFGDGGLAHLHDLAADSFLALHFTDVRRRPRIAGDERPGLRRLVVSRWDAPHDSGLRERAMFDPAERVKRRLGVPDDTLLLLRPDAHVAAIVPFDPTAGDDVAGQLYDRITGSEQRREQEWQTATS